MALVPTVIFFGDLDTKLDKDSAKPLPKPSVNKNYFRLYQTGFLIIQVVFLLGMIYVLLIKPFRDGVSTAVANPT